MSEQDSCAFCDGSVDARIITDLGLIRAVYPLSPAVPYHVLLIPKRHAPQFDALNQQEAAQILLLVQRLVGMARAHVPEFVGYNLLSNNGGAAVRQRVTHCHLHVFLRSANGKDPLAGGHGSALREMTDSDKQRLDELRNWLNAS